MADLSPGLQYTVPHPPTNSNNHLLIIAQPEMSSPGPSTVVIRRSSGLITLDLTSTPRAEGKHNRISQFFQRSKLKKDEKCKDNEPVNAGIGRDIPVKQGFLYKKATKTTLSEWKKKYACLYSDGRLSYYPSLKEYVNGSNTGKEVFLSFASVKYTGKPRPPIIRRTETTRTRKSVRSIKRKVSVHPTPSATPRSGQFLRNEPIRRSSLKSRKVRSGRKKTSSVQKETKREYRFEVISSDEKFWEFSALSSEERDAWVSGIKMQIEKSIESRTSSSKSTNTGTRQQIDSLRHIAGNEFCADCRTPLPDWASTNLGILICVECCGAHRKLGTHISRVRSLLLDDWPLECLSVMRFIGNEDANRYWEQCVPNGRKPLPDSSCETKERWIRAKYERKQFVKLEVLGSCENDRTQEALSQTPQVVQDNTLYVVDSMNTKDKQSSQETLRTTNESWSIGKFLSSPRIKPFFVRSNKAESSHKRFHAGTKAVSQTGQPESERTPVPKLRRSLGYSRMLMDENKENALSDKDATVMDSPKVCTSHEQLYQHGSMDESIVVGPNTNRRFTVIGRFTIECPVRRDAIHNESKDLPRLASESNHSVT